MRGQMRRQDVVVAPTRDQTARALREARRTGFLSMPARSLTEFPANAYHLEEHMDKDEKKWECVDLLKIDLSHNAIASISDEIAGLSTVVSIKMCQNALQSLPEGFFDLTALTYLDLSNNQLQGNLSEGLGRLVHLKELSLANNRLARLPESLGELKQIEALRIEDNAITHLPEEIGKLSKLHVLTAFGNQLSQLPSSFGALRNMQTLDLKKNRLETTSDALSTLTALKYLDLRNNKLVVFPALPASAMLDQVFLGYNLLSSIDEDSVLRIKDALTVLEVRDNKLSVLPTKLPHLYRLKTLDVANNDLSDLPPGLGYLKHLNHFVTDGNPLRAIRRSVVSAGCEALKKHLRSRGPPPVGVDVLEEEIDDTFRPQQEQRLQSENDTAKDNLVGSPHLVKVFREAASSGTLDMSNSGLHRAPAQLGAGNEWNFGATLLNLNLSKNSLTALSSEIGELSVLKSLTAEENRLTTLDVSIAALPSLQLLRLRKNLLTAASVDLFLGPSPGISRSLKELDLRNNELTSVPTAIGGLHSLETLLLSFNKIETLDGFPWDELRAVAVVSVSDNKLRSLGRVFDAPMLASLSFENNNLSTVPCELGLCPNLRAIYMNGNPQRTVRGAVIAKGSQEILTYLKNKLPPDATLTPAPRQSPTTAATHPAQAKLTVGPSRRRDLGFAAQGDEAEEPRPPAVASLTNRTDHTTTARAKPMLLSQEVEPTESGDAFHDAGSGDLELQIRQCERELESCSVSAAKRFALKKELALLRATRIRQERAKQCR